MQLSFVKEAPVILNIYNFILESINIVIVIKTDVEEKVRNLFLERLITVEKNIQRTSPFTSALTRQKSIFSITLDDNFDPKSKTFKYIKKRPNKIKI
jgi:hypothetical protein